MNTESQAPELEGITYRDSLPIDWEVLPEIPSEGELHRYNHANEELLQNLLLRDESSHDTEEVEEDSGQEHLKRLETKMDLILSLVTEMMTSNERLPQRRDLILGTRGLCVHTQEDDIATLKEGMPLRVRLFLDPQFPRPFDICGQLVTFQAESFTVSYGPLEARLQDLLDKLVFRRHRRAIALSRRTTER